MRIRNKLAITFILLIVAGVTAISSFAILVIRNYLIDEGKEELRRDARRIGLSLQTRRPSVRLDTLMARLSAITGYHLAAFNAAGQPVAGTTPSQDLPFPDSLRARLRDSGRAGPIVLPVDANGYIHVLARLPGPGMDVRYLRLAQPERDTYAAITRIRWIIYYGMFISIGVVIVVSTLLARSISRPIQQLTREAEAVAGGQLGRPITLNRRDEFGTLAQSLNQMAGRLRAESDKLRALNAQQSQFYADIAHEIRNPLHSLSGALEMLEVGSLPADQHRQYLALARRQTDRLSRLFRDLMTIQRSDAGEHFLQQRAVELGQLCADLEQAYAASAAQAGVQLRVKTAPQHVWADPDKLEQVLDNLLSNAMKYTASGCITVSYDQETDGTQVRVEVRDTGIGVAAGQRERLFDRFYRTDNARSRDKGGAGLGLAVVKSILDAHGTTIEADANPGGGSVFRFWLPAAGAD